ncbi:MAG: DUF4446 family protein [Lachnospiraceae bacterium]|nr:DUF4446 family protein [Lachnospiraceae bacterium]
MNTNISQSLGIDLDFAIIIIFVLAAVVLVLLILAIWNMVYIRKLKKRYDIFMSGKDGKTLEDTLIRRLEQVDHLLAANKENELNIKRMFENNKNVFQKIGLIKYDAFNEMGGKLSFSVCLLNEKDDGFIINAMHSREGCYTYIKEIIDGNSIIVLSKEEEDALMAALEYKKELSMTKA